MNDAQEVVKKFDHLKLTNNSKVRFYEKHNNTFSLRQGRPEDGGTCPHATQGKGGCLSVCYDANLRKLYKNYAAVEDDNTALVRGAKDAAELVGILEKTVSVWLAGDKKDKKFFRIHTGGDFYNMDYVVAWARVIEKFSGVRFWAYTRSLFAISTLAELKNLTLLLSCDPVNKDEVLKAYAPYRDYPNVTVAWMGNDFPEEHLSDRSVLICPEVTKKVKNTKEIGACARCRACIDRPLKSGFFRYIQFPIHR
jgi:hypothetical protein